MHSPFYNFQRGAGTVSGPVIVTPAPQPTGHTLPDSVRDERLSICAGCENNRDGLCIKCQHCSGRKIDFKVQAVFEFCPLSPPKWKQWLQPK